MKLRTMFKEQSSQYRYHKIENETYPLSAVKRQKLIDALNWMAGATNGTERRDKTWTITDKNEVLLVYPSKLRSTTPNLARQFKRCMTDEQMRARFEDEAENFQKYVTWTKELGTNHYPDNIQIFMLRKLDKARTKVIYTRCATPNEIVLCSDRWRKAAENLPRMTSLLSVKWTPFPLEVSGIMNRVWKRDGTSDIDKYTENYHGIELLFGVPESVLEADLHRLADNAANLAVYAGMRFNSSRGRRQNSPKDEKVWQIRETLILTGMFLYCLNIRKGDYVNEYPYLLGQLLKVSDSLHELYCYKVREGEIPPQLVGSSMYVSATETPLQTLAQLGKRMSPYLTWARAHIDVKAPEIKRTDKNGNEVIIQGISAGYLLYIYNRIANSLSESFTPKSRFDDRDKALLFIGYLASFQKSGKMPEISNGDETIFGGTDNEK